MRRKVGGFEPTYLQTGVELQLEVKEFRFAVERLKGQRQLLQQQIKATKGKIEALIEEEEDCQKGRVLIQVAAKQTQDQLQYHLSELAKLALAAVFEDPYEFEISFEQRRGRTEADFWFVRNGERIDPAGNSGLGAVDIVGLALRTSLWSLRHPRTRASIWTDEPLKHLKGEGANQRALQIFKEVAHANKPKKWDGCQIVMVADERATREDIAEAADKVFEVTKGKYHSRVEEKGEKHESTFSRSRHAGSSSNGARR